LVASSPLEGLLFSGFVLQSGFPFLTFQFNSLHRSKGFPLQGFSRHCSTVFPVVPEGAGFASGEHATPRKTVLPGRIRRHFPRQTRAVIEICFALHAPYPAGDGNAAIFCSMFPKSRLVRWPSASSNQQ
jgi:hypothetical protein